MTVTRVASLLLPLSLALTGAGCFATRSDVVKLQAQMQAMQDSLRLQQARSDDAHRTQMITLARQVTTQVGGVADSLRFIGEMLKRFQGDVALSSHSVSEQLLTLAERVGVSQRSLQELRANFEGTEQRLSASQPPAVGASSTAIAPSAATNPPPNQLFAVAQQQLRAGATGAARAAFEDFLAQYPTNELAGDAQMWIGDSYAQEGNKPAADSAWAIVYGKYPANRYASSRSLYESAMLKKEAGRNAEAIALFQTIVDKYPRDNEAPLASDWIKSLKKP